MNVTTHTAGTQVASCAPENTGTTVAGSLRVHHQEQDDTFVVSWEGEQIDIRACYGELMEHVTQLRPMKWLIDLQHYHSLTSEDQAWVIQHLFPQVLRLIKDDVFVAVVLPLSLYQGLVENLSGDEMMDQNNFLIVQQFLYREEALRWLRHMQLLKQGERSLKLLHTTI